MCNGDQSEHPIHETDKCHFNYAWDKLWIMVVGVLCHQHPYYWSSYYLVLKILKMLSKNIQVCNCLYSKVQEEKKRA